MPHMMDVLKTMRLPQKISLAKTMWQDVTASKDKAPSHDGAANHNEDASQDEAVSSKGNNALHKGTA